MFPNEGKFFIQANAGTYDKNLKVWKILGEYWVNVTIKKGLDTKVERTTTRPKVTPRKMTGGPGITKNPWETVKSDTRDTLQDKNTETKPKSHTHPPPSWPLYQSLHLGEAPINLLISFQPNPKIDELTKLILSASSAIYRDSVVVSITLGDSIDVTK